MTCSQQNYWGSKSYSLLPVPVPMQTKRLPYFDPALNEKIFPSLFFELMQNSARCCGLDGRNGIEPMIGSENREGGELRPLSLVLYRRHSK